MPRPFRIPSHVRPVIDDDGAVLLDIRRDRYFSLNATGVEIWKQIEAGRPISETRDHIAGTFDVDQDVAAQDIAHFVAQLKQAGLLSDRD